MRSLREATLYPGVALVEGANVSVGRGTPTPFELFGAPWIDARALASYLNRRGIRGIRFASTDFTPTADPFKGRPCHGLRIILEDRRRLDAPALGIELASALARLYPRRFQLERTLGMVGARGITEAIRHGVDPHAIARHWRVPLQRFLRLRAKYLLYA